MSRRPSEPSAPKSGPRPGPPRGRLEPLPIDGLLPPLVEALRSSNRLVLRAEPGAGKTTRVPPALLDAGLAEAGEIVVLEPRRVAARAAAEFVARERGTTLGAEVGYRVRHDTCGGPATRLWYVTEGVLGRQLVRDPFLEKVGIVILDEFHERHLAGDVALGVVRELQETVRPDLRLVVMSATLATERLATWLGGCPVLDSKGRQFPVEIRYSGASTAPLPVRVAGVVEAAVTSPDSDGGDLLVFLPGASEIRRTAERLEAAGVTRRADVIPLHGDLPLPAQQQALRRGPRQRIVLATNVAETSLTVEGVTTVVDAGLVREARYDASRGLDVLRLVPISAASAVQRAGRAGRLAPGVCLRLGTEAEFTQRRAFDTPEVRRLDLSGTVLELRAWGARDLLAFPWLDPPTSTSLEQAERLLRWLGAVDSDGAVTPTGREMLRLPLPPRIARWLVEARRRGCAEETALLVALATERDILLEHRTFAVSDGGRWKSGPSDLLLRAERFEAAAQAGFDRTACDRLGVDRRTVLAVDRTRRSLTRSPREESRATSLGTSSAATAEPDRDAVLASVLAGFPDRVCRRRQAGSDSAAMVGGSSVRLAPTSVVRDDELFLALEVAGTKRQGMAMAEVRVASAVRREWLEELFPGSVERVEELRFEPAAERVLAVREVRYHDLVLARTTSTEVAPRQAGGPLAEAAAANPRAALTVSPEVEALLARLEFLRSRDPSFAGGLAAEERLAEVARQAATGCRSFAETRRVRVVDLLRAGLPPGTAAVLAREAPERFRLPTGREVTLSYEAGRNPSVAARVQELFGLRTTPRLAFGQVPLVVELLAPNGRPVQITDDLAGFWQRTYPEVRKDLRGRYPRHPWPDDPLTAPPTARTKKAAARDTSRGT